MDDKEYYSLMNRSNSALIIQALQKKQQLKKNQLPVKKWEIQQGREDAQMLYEKQGGEDSVTDTTS